MGPNRPAPMVNPFATYAIVAAGLFAFLLLIGSLLIWRRSRKRKAERANAISTHPTTSPFRHRGSLPVYTVTPEPSSVYLATPSSWNNQPQSPYQYATTLGDTTRISPLPPLDHEARKIYRPPPPYTKQ